MNSQRVLLTFILIILVSVGITAALGMTTSAGEMSADSGHDNTPGNLIGAGNGPQSTVSASHKDTSAPDGQAATVIPRPGAGNYRTRVVLLGTNGGVSWYPGTNRVFSSSALVVNDTIYIIDLGHGSTYRLAEAFNKGSFVNTEGGKIEDGSSIAFQDIRALFFTHLHQDHVADYPAFLLIGPGTGLGTYTNPVTKKTAIAPLKVFGPGSRGQLEDDKSNYIGKGGHILSTDSAFLENVTRTPGTRLMTQNIFEAFAQTINDMTLDNGYPDFTRLINVTEIGGAKPWDIPLPVTVTDPNSGTCPKMDPFEVYQDDRVRVTAILVDHHQVYPAFAYRFDTDDGSVVFSGDTGAETNGNLEKLSDGADILVHEVIDESWVEQKFGKTEPGTQMDALKTHLLTSHTSIAEVGRVAENCSVTTLVLNHIVPGNTPAGHLQMASGNFTGKLIIGEDLMQIGIGRAGRAS